MRRRFAAALAAAICLSAAQGAADGCQLSPIGTARVASVRDGRTLALADGRVLRLAAVEVTDSARAVLHRLADGQTLRLAKLDADRDRYGRLVAFAFAGDAGQTLQQALLAAGAARVGVRVGDKACAESLLAAEREARAGRRGLWADPNFAPLAADNSARLAAETGHFALVEGKILSVHPSGATLYLNFGERWTKDFSVIILRRNLRKFSAAGLVPQRLQGRRIRVRGFLERRGGSLIEADAPEQIEPLD